MKKSEKLQADPLEELTIAFKFPLPPCLTLNKQIDLARSHWTKSAKFKKEWTNHMAELATSQIPKEITGSPVFPGKIWISYFWLVNSCANDEDNVSACRKYICDGLKIAKIIVDDNLTIIQSPTITHWKIIKQISNHTVGANNQKIFLPKHLKEYPTNQTAIVIISNSIKYGLEIIKDLTISNETL